MEESERHRQRQEGERQKDGGERVTQTETEESGRQKRVRDTETGE